MALRASGRDGPVSAHQRPNTPQPYPRGYRSVSAAHTPSTPSPTPRNNTTVASPAMAMYRNID
ncbi:hypothetical protein GCM10007147_39330 [Nocardiopsis kunsanensis]|uniref:Uncharacterized protein n=1 Tax=Nocardiopsis kunsanensis TaxID=141693 RepID=A0A918XJ03_9ACTN|nr:hypothetical protein GCM10007147_39330 [Nocardiopsis kunsanensis]